MWWYRCSTSDRRTSFGVIWIAIFVAVAVALMTSFSRGWGNDSWMVWPFFFFVIPLVISRRRFRREQRRYGDEYEKPKRDFDEKPKRTGEYVMSDDGEPLEVIEEEPKHKREDTPYV